FHRWFLQKTVGPAKGPTDAVSKRAKEIQNRLFVIFRETVETINHSVGLRRSVLARILVLRRIVSAIRTFERDVVLNGDHKIAGAAVVQEEQPRTQTP